MGIHRLLGGKAVSYGINTVNNKRKMNDDIIQHLLHACAVSSLPSSQSWSPSQRHFPRIHLPLAHMNSLMAHLYCPVSDPLAANNDFEFSAPIKLEQTNAVNKNK